MLQLQWNHVIKPSDGLCFLGYYSRNYATYNVVKPSVGFCVPCFQGRWLFSLESRIECSLWSLHLPPWYDVIEHSDGLYLPSEYHILPYQHDLGYIMKESMSDWSLCSFVSVLKIDNTCL